jgi:hypothetical protein
MYGVERQKPGEVAVSQHFDGRANVLVLVFRMNVVVFNFVARQKIDRFLSRPSCETGNFRFSIDQSSLRCDLIGEKFKIGRSILN